jgi:hypothetical protein
MCWLQLKAAQGHRRPMKTKRATFEESADVFPSSSHRWMRAYSSISANQSTANRPPSENRL